MDASASGGRRSTYRAISRPATWDATSAARSSASGVSSLAAILPSSSRERNAGEQRRRELVAERGAQQHDPALARLGHLPRLEQVPHDALADLVSGPLEDLGQRQVGAHRRPDGLAEQVGLGAEVVVQQRGIHPRPRRDRAHRGAVVAVLAELVDGRRDDAVPRVGPAPARPAARPLRRRNGVVRHAVSLDRRPRRVPGRDRAKCDCDDGA